MTNWYYADANLQQRGPVTSEGLAGLLRSGEVHQETLVWREGMTQWAPLREFAAELVPPPSVAHAIPARAPEAPVIGKQAPVEIVYAGFWRRWAALFIDQLILSLAFYALVFALIVAAAIGGWVDMGALDSEHPSPLLVVGYVGILLFYYVAAAAYYTLSESSRQQATLGKRAVGIKVVDLHGQRLTWGHAIGRWCAASLSYLSMYIGFAMAGFTARKQALHDMVASTLVVDRWAYTDFPERQQRGPGGCAIVAIAGVVILIGIAVVGILAAIALPAYQSYTQRAGVAQVVAATASLRSKALDYHVREQRCADDAMVGIDADGTVPGLAHVEHAQAGAFEGGGCGLEVTLGGFNSATLDGHKLWWTITPAGEWTCSSDLDGAQQPAGCRE